MPEPPVLRDVRTISPADALLDWDEKLPEMENGEPKTIWDGTSMKPHPVTGRPVPDHSGRLTVYRYVNPRRQVRSEEHTSELQSLMRISYDAFCLKKKKKQTRLQTIKRI